MSAKQINNLMLHGSSLQNTYKKAHQYGLSASTLKPYCIRFVLVYTYQFPLIFNCHQHPSALQMDSLCMPPFCTSMRMHAVQLLLFTRETVPDGDIHTRLQGTVNLMHGMSWEVDQWFYAHFFMYDTMKYSNLY